MASSKPGTASAKARKEKLVPLRSQGSALYRLVNVVDLKAVAWDPWCPTISNGFRDVKATAKQHPVIVFRTFPLWAVYPDGVGYDEASRH